MFSPSLYHVPSEDIHAIYRCKNTHENRQLESPTFQGREPPNFTSFFKSGPFANTWQSLVELRVVTSDEDRTRAKHNGLNCTTVPCMHVYTFVE